MRAIAALPSLCGGEGGCERSEHRVGRATAPHPARTCGPPHPPLAGRDNSPRQLAPALRQRAQAQRLEPDEALRVLLIVGDRAVLERDEFLIVERIGTVATDDGSLALV